MVLGARHWTTGFSEEKPRAFWVCLCLRYSGLEFREEVWFAGINLGVDSVGVIFKASGREEIKEKEGRGRQEERRKRRREEREEKRSKERGREER